MPQAVYSIDQVAEILQLSRQTICKLIHRGELHHVRIGGVYRILESSLDSLLDPDRQKSPQGTQPPTPANPPTT